MSEVEIHDLKLLPGLWESKLFSKTKPQLLAMTYRCLRESGGVHPCKNPYIIPMSTPYNGTYITSILIPPLPRKHQQDDGKK